MLTHLSIRNIVLIDQCALEFGSGLTVLTGETGAGKSILLDALGLVLGGRADASLVRRGEASASVTAEFDIRDHAGAQAMLTELDMEGADVLVLRRTLEADGKSRAFVNDSPVSAAALKRLGETLVEVQGQHDQRGLLDGSSHRTLLDAFGACGASLKKVQVAHAAWRQAALVLAELEAQIAQAKREEDYLRHVARELAQLDPQPGEEAKLSQQRQDMMQSEKLFALLSEALGEIAGASPASARLRSAQRLLLRSALNAEGRFASVIDQLDRAAEAADAAHEALEAVGREATYNPAKLEAVEERLFGLKAGARKYNLPVEELAAFREEAEAKLALLDAQGKSAGAAVQAEAEAKRAYVAAAAALTEARLKAARKLEKAIAAELTPLKMGGARFSVKIEPLPEAQWAAHGVDAVVFEAATNAGAASAPLHKIASGGELSRFLLALKVALSGVRSTPTLIFDEIDAGTGGAVAAAIGERLALLAGEVQVLAITHLPQVAARGGAHLVVSKQSAKGRTLTAVKALSESERMEELARMLSGASVTAEARKAAAKLLEVVA